MMTSRVTPRREWPSEREATFAPFLLRDTDGRLKAVFRLSDREAREAPLRFMDWLRDAGRLLGPGTYSPRLEQYRRPDLGSTEIRLVRVDDD